MNTIVKKCWPGFFQFIVDGKKKFDLRVADFDIAEGDQLKLKEWDPKNNSYTGREVTVQVTYVLKTASQRLWSKEDVDQYGFQVIQFEMPDGLERQRDKEEAIRSAFQQNMALLRRGLSVVGLRKDGSEILVSQSNNFDSLWSDAKKALK
ncbi:MAG: DUF3850 domain-containing protein [bacterium]|nr:DUF3850 domain-containing protein [bacterium]